MLHEAEDVGVNIGSISFGKHVLEDFTIYCSHSINLLDSLYYALVSIAGVRTERSICDYKYINFLRLISLGSHQRKKYRSML